MRYLLLVAGLAWVAGGCGAMVPPAPVSADANYNALWNASLQVLRDHRFEVDRNDPREGVITTYPLLGRHWFECWRSDAMTAGDVLEGTLQTIHRQAAVTLRPIPAGAEGAAGRYEVTVEVRTTRSDRPRPQIDRAGEAYRVFLNPKSQHPQGPAAPEAQVYLGRDANLEYYLQEKIVAQAIRNMRK